MIYREIIFFIFTLAVFRAISLSGKFLCVLQLRPFVRSVNNILNSPWFLRLV
jgi:hypothetical protein